MIRKFIRLIPAAAALIAPLTFGVMVIDNAREIVCSVSREVYQNIVLQRKSLAMPVVMAITGSAPPSPSFRNYYEDTSSQTTYTFSSCDIGTAHSSRMVVVCIAASNVPGAVSSCTVNGVSAASVVTSGNTARHCEIWRAAVTSGTTGVTISVAFSGAGSTNCAIGVYATYPGSQTPVDALGTSGASNANRALTDLAKTAGGFAIFGAVANDTGKTTTVTYTGETITKNRENTAFDSNVKCYAFHSALTISSTTTLDDPACAWSATASGVGFVGATWA